MKKCLNIKKKKKRKKKIKLGSCFGSNEPLVICIFVFIMVFPFEKTNKQKVSNLLGKLFLYGQQWVIIIQMV